MTYHYSDVKEAMSDIITMAPPIGWDLPVLLPDDFKDNTITLTDIAIKTGYYIAKKEGQKMTYQRGKESARQYAIEIQQELAESSPSYGDLLEVQAKLEALGKRYGLLKEFRENGLL